MAYVKFPSQPGVHKDDSPLEAKLYWVDADKIRFVSGLPETIYGWERASTALLLGITRGSITWADNARNPYAAYGTHLRLYVMDLDGNITDITPVDSRGFATSISFTTILGSAVVIAAWTSHGLVIDQKFLLENASTPTVGGITINGGVVVSVTDANTFTYTAGSIATSNAGPTASTVDWSKYLAPGQLDGIGGLGFGTGGIGTGGYASAASGLTYWPRSWSLTQWGQNLIANPRGLGVYEWAPNVTATELVTNGTFTGSAAGWTTGAGWAYGANNVVASSSTGDLSQAIANLPVGAWCLLKGNVSAYTSGTIQPKVNGTAVGSAISAAGKFANAFFTGSGGTQTLAITTASSTASLTIDDISIQVETYANLIANAPTQVTCVFTTAERILVACGCPNANGTFDALRVRWTDQENNQTWTSTTANLAGSDTLSNGSRIVRGLPGGHENVIFTDTSIFSMRYVPDPNVVYDFTEIGSGCGLAGPNAATQLAGVFFWYSNNGEFFKYDGGYPMPLVCTLKRDVRDNLAWVQQDKIYASPMAGRNEIWWFYPDQRDGSECSRYVIYNIVDGTWSCGTFQRTSWMDAGIFQYPIAVDTSGQIWFHEKGFSQDGGARSWSLTSAFFDLGDGNNHMRILGMQPDAASVQGNYQVQFNTRLRNSTSISTRAFGPYSVMQTSGKISVRANGQEAQLIFSATGSPTFWRGGALRLDIEQTGQTR